MNQGWKIGIVVALSIVLIAGIFLLRKRIPEEPARPLFAEDRFDPTPTLKPFLGQARKPSPPTPTPVMNEDERLVEQMEFLALARYQRSSYHRVYLPVLRQIYLDDPLSQSVMSDNPKWPEEIFEMDFEAFHKDRLQYRHVLDASSAEIAAWLDDISGILLDLVPDARDGVREFVNGEEVLREDLAELDSLIQAWEWELCGDPEAATDVLLEASATVGDVSGATY